MSNSITAAWLIPLSVRGTIHSPGDYEGDANLYLPILVLLGEGDDDLDADASLVLPALNVSGADITDEHGNASIVLPALSSAGETITDEIGIASLDLPAIRVSGEGQDTILGDAILLLPRLTIQSEGLVSALGIAEIKIPSLIVSVVGYDEVSGNLDKSIPRLTLSAVGILLGIGDGSVTIPMLKLSATDEALEYLSMVLNIKNRALTLYDNYKFNSLCRFNGKHLGMTESGIYDLDSGDTDAGTLIEWNFRTGYLDLHQKEKKRLKQAWFSYKSNGDIVVTAVTPDGTEYEYGLTGVEATEDGVRVKFGKGLKSKYVALNVKNADGSTITLDTLKLHFEKLSLLR